MNLLKRCYYWLNPKTEIIQDLYEGEVTLKTREKLPPKSYSLYMPQSMLTAAYLEDPDRYDDFLVTIGSKTLSVPKWLYDSLEKGKRVSLTVTYPKSGTSLMAALDDLGKEKYDLKILS